MDIEVFENTVSDSKEESIAKAISLIQEDFPVKQTLKRPNISTTKILIKFVLWLVIMGVVWIFCVHINEVSQISGYILYPIAIAVCLLIIVLKTKSLVQNAILLYQKYAPEKMRCSCLFTPSCSEYMLLAIEKYGVIRGVYKGIRRLGRCHYPNGGEDYP